MVTIRHVGWSASVDDNNNFSGDEILILLMQMFLKHLRTGMGDPHMEMANKLKEKYPDMEISATPITKYSNMPNRIF